MSEPNTPKDWSHFFLQGTDGTRIEKKRKERPKDSPPRFPQTSGSQKGTLTTKADIARGQSLDKKSIFDDNRLYFVIKFSDSLSWKPVKLTLESLGGHLTQIYGDKTVKLAIQKLRYESFVSALEKGRRYVSDVNESTGSEKIDEELAQRLEAEPNLPQKITIEVVDISGLRFAPELEASLKRYVQEQGGEISLGYHSDRFAVFTANLFPHTVKEIADKIELSEHLHVIPQISLASNRVNSRGIGLASLMSTSKTTPSMLPVVCAIDTGVNRNHRLLSNYVVDVLDFSDSPAVPAQDTDGHGSKVAGVMIYGGSCSSHTEPLTRVIMAKGFETQNRLINDILHTIVRTTERFASTTKVFNFSFAAFGPNPSLTKVLDDIIYYRDIIVVACTGNIDTLAIRNDLESNRGYPDYIMRHPIFFPGDAKNAITVGALASSDSNICRKNSPSPFTRAGIKNDNNIKPDVIEDGGNINAIWQDSAISEFSHNGIGVSSASFLNDEELLEDIGTSFASPVVATIAANILKKYPTATTSLVKAIILSSCSPLQESIGKNFDSSLQGYGHPDLQSSISSTRWRTYYLIQGSFDGSNSRAHRSYEFDFPDNADRLKLTIVSSKPADSRTHLGYRLVKSGSKNTSTPPKPRQHLGSSRVATTHQAIFDVKRGGKGPWTIDIIPHFDQTPNMDKSIKYGCVVSVESTKHLDVYSAISRWMSKSARKPVLAKITEFV